LLDADRSLVWESRGGLTVLHLIAYRGDMEAAPLVVMKGAQLNAGGDAGTPLYQAVRAGHEPMVQYLLALDADANIATSSGVTPLMVAALEGYSGLVRRLLAAGASVDARTGEGVCDLFAVDVPVCGESALHLAASRGQLDVVRLLLAASATREIEDRLGQTPAHWAARYGQRTALALLQAPR
jgi:ankyrin repeat protein